MTNPSQDQMVEAIRKEIGLDITFMVKTIRGLWPTLKQQRPTNDDMVAGQLLVGQADDLIMEKPYDRPVRAVYIVHPQLFIQLALMEGSRVDQNFGGFPVWACTIPEDEMEAFLLTLVHNRQDQMWQDAIKQAEPRFSFNVPTEPILHFPSGKSKRTEADADIERENRA